MAERTIVHLVRHGEVDNPKGLQFGGLIAAPVVRNILADTLRYLEVEPRKEQLAKKLNYGDIPYVEVPNLIGRTISDIYQEMNLDFQLARSGAGTVVVNQAPKPGTRVPQGSTIRIYHNCNVTSFPNLIRR